MMKRIFSLIMTVGLLTAANAQTLNVQTGNVTYAIPASQAGEMVYTDGTQLTILGRTFNLTDITSMYVDDTEVEDNTVVVTYDGTTASVTVAGNIAQYVEPTVESAYVSIVQSDNVGDSTCGEITYSLSGESSDGSFYMEGSYKASIELRGLTLTNTSGAPIDIQNGKRIDISVKNGTVNTLTDCSNGDQKGCIVCKGHIELKGKGTLNVYGNTSHAIYAKEYVEMKNCTVNVLSAIKDGINCNQYFLMESGTLNISGTNDDGIQVSYKDDTDRDEEDTGSISIEDGNITISITATASKGLKADGDIAISGGTIDITTSGGGKWDSDDVKTKASACISADGNVTIDGGTLTLTSTGSGGKGINCDGNLDINDGDITISTSGGLYAYVNGREYDDYTGNTDNLDSDYKSSPKGIKADGNITITGGTINVTTTGNGGEGIESKAIMTIEDGTIDIYSYDDGLNSSSHMYLNGGNITSVSTDNDAIDSNGNMYVNGGVIRAFGSENPEGGIDADEESGYSVIFTGGTLIAVGGSNSTPTSSESTQAYVSGTGSVTTGSTITLSSGTNTLASFTVPDNYTSSSSQGGSSPGMGGGPGGGIGGNNSNYEILITCPGLTSGSRYTLTNGSSSSSVTAKTGSSNSRPF